jgi:hypothetical protein
MKRIRSDYHKLHALNEARPKLRQAVISNCDKDVVHSVSECALNVLRGNVKLSDCTKRKLRKLKHQLRAVVDKRLSITSKKKLIIQRGGFLVPLMMAIQPSKATLIFD